MKGRKSLTRRFMQAVLAQRHEVNYDTPLPELIEGYFPDVHQGITTDNFPPEEGETGRKLVEFWWFSNPALGDGYFPASLRDMLALCHVNPRPFRKFRAFAMRRGIAGPSPLPFFPFICNGRLGLSSRPMKPWLKKPCRFLGVKYLDKEE